MRNIVLVAVIIFLAMTACTTLERKPDSVKLDGHRAETLGERMFNRR